MKQIDLELRRDAKAVLIVANFKPLNERAIYNGILGAMFAIASVAGPLIGGAFTGTLSNADSPNHIANPKM